MDEIKLEKHQKTTDGSNGFADGRFEYPLIKNGFF